MDLTGSIRPGWAAQNQPWSTLHGLGEIGEELVGQFLGRAVDQALAELGELAADLGFDVIAQQGTAILFGERHGGATLGEAGDAALAFARDLVAIGWIEIAQIDLALEAGGDRPDLHFGGGAEAVVLGPFQLLAARNAGLQHLRIVLLVPHRLARRRTLDFAVHRTEHGGATWLTCALTTR